MTWLCDWPPLVRLLREVRAEARSFANRTAATFPKDYAGPVCGKCDITLAELTEAVRAVHDQADAALAVLDLRAPALVRKVADND